MIFLAIDDYVLPFRNRICLHITKPNVRQEPVLTPERGDSSAPDNAAVHFYGGVVFDNGKYRMWYYACHWGDTPSQHDPLIGNLVTGPVCYAESEDGIRWNKPELGQVEWRASRRNNIIRLNSQINEGVHVIKDEKDPDASRRYKMVYNYLPTDRNFWTIRTAVSADGLVWKEGQELPYDGFLEQASLYEFNGNYYVNGQMCLRSEGGNPSGRQGFVIISPDFEHWIEECGESFLLPEPAEHVLRGADKAYDQTHIGVGATSFGNVLVGLYCIWHNKPYITGEKDWFGMGTTSGDFGLVVSNDGIHFREPVKSFVFMHRDESRPTMPDGVKYDAVLCQGNGILNVGDETRIYHGRWANTADVKDYYAEIALATIPRDRWGALGIFPDADSGTLWSAPVKIDNGCKVALNSDGNAGIKVEIGDDRFSLIPEYSGENAGVVRGAGGLDCPAVWKKPITEKLTNKTVRFRLRLEKTANTDPRFYAMYLN